jgi:hypothetical protein
VQGWWECTSEFFRAFADAEPPKSREIRRSDATYRRARWFARLCMFR